MQKEFNLRRNTHSEICSLFCYITKVYRVNLKKRYVFFERAVTHVREFFPSFLGCDLKVKQR